MKLKRKKKKIQNPEIKTFETKNIAVLLSLYSSS